MKFLLTAINSKFIHSNPAIYSLKSFAGEEYKADVEIAEYTINHRLEQILADIYYRKPDVIGISCYIWNISMVHALLVELHKIFPELPIWLGGPEVSYDAKDLLEQYPFLTGIMLGEGEESFLDLLKYYKGEEGIRLEEIHGLCLQSGKTPKRNLTNLTSLPFLYEEMSAFQHRIIYYESSRGCPFSCSYCLSSIDKSVRLRDSELVKKELLFFLSQKLPQVKFIDRTFNCNRKHAMDIWNTISEHDNGITNFHFEIAADILSTEEISLLQSMRPGLVQLEIGVQTTNETTLNEIRRSMDMTKLKQNIKAIQKANNVHIHLDLIAGLPFEGYDSFKASFLEVYDMKPEQLQLGFLKVLKGSYMHTMAKEYGLVYQDQAPYEVLFTKWLSYEELLRLKQVEEMVEIYYNSNQFCNSLPLIEQLFEDPFSMFESLAHYYEKNGYFIQVPARSYRYQVLLDFAMEHDQKNDHTIYKESLTLDLYLRENSKSRPVFAKDLTPFKEEQHQFYQEEEALRRLLPHYEGHDKKQIMKMCHMDWFTYPVWDTEKAKQRQKLEKACKVLFDYKERNPLTKDARIIVME